MWIVEREGKGCCGGERERTKRGVGGETVGVDVEQGEQRRGRDDLSAGGSGRTG